MAKIQLELNSENEASALALRDEVKAYIEAKYNDTAIIIPGVSKRKNG